MFRKLVRAQINPLGEREVEVVLSTDALAHDGHILIPQGCRLANYRANPVVLWSHDPESPVGTSENIAVGQNRITARAMFAPAGISRKADEICGLVKAGVIRGVSVGFEPVESEPLDPKKPRAGQRISVWDLLEFSFVSVPADPGAIVTARAGRAGKVLNGENAQALREAHDLAERCRSTIADVLDGAGEGPGAAPIEEEARMSADFRRREADVLRLAIGPDPGGCDADFKRRQRDAEALALVAWV